MAAWWPARPATSHKWRPRCGWWPAARAWAARPRWPRRAPSAPAPATCGCRAPGGLGGVDAPGRGRAARAGRRRLGRRRCSTASTASVRWSSATAWAPTTPPATRSGRVLAARTEAPVPTVVDADGLTALGARRPTAWSGPTPSLTPHDGEFARLAGAAARRRPPGRRRVELAERLGCVVLLKGGPTVVADPRGDVLVVATGDARLATAGTGDVLAGVIGALCARGLDPWHGGGRRSVPARRGRRSRLARRLRGRRPDRPSAPRRSTGSSAGSVA